MPLTRRCLLSAFATVVLDEALGAKRGGDPDTTKPTLVTQVASLHNFYDAWWAKGAAACAAFLQLHNSTLLQSEGDFPGRGLKEINETIVKTKGNMVLNLDAPPTVNDLRGLIDLCTKHKIYFVTHNNLPPSNLRPWNFSSYYVAHIEFDHKLAGLKTARHLINAMGGKGGIIAFLGKRDVPVSDDRRNGLEAALAPYTPNCHLLDTPDDAEWQASAAYDIMLSLIAKHGADRIDGVWAANDDMALGAIEALRLHKKPIPPVTGIDGSPEALNAIQRGDMAATAAWDSFWQGGIGLSLAVSAKRGEFDPSKEPNSHRAFYGPFWLVTGDNVHTFLEYHDSEHPVMFWKDFWGQSTGPIPEV